jgi:hypothetical protein
MRCLIELTFHVASRTDTNGSRPAQSGEIVYTADAYRGKHVLRDRPGTTGKKVKAPVPAKWFGSATADSPSFKPHPDCGFMCPIVKPDVDTP